MMQLELFSPKRCDICKQKVGMTRNAFLHDGVRDTKLNVFLCFRCRHERNIMGDTAWIEKHQQTLETLKNKKS